MAYHLKVELTPEQPLPPILYKSRTPLSVYQDAIEPQRGFRPSAFGNAYIFRLNQVFLLDDADYCARKERNFDDSLAHELVHFLQFRYMGWTEEKLRENSCAVDSIEGEAIPAQKWFRGPSPRRSGLPLDHILGPST